MSKKIYGYNPVTGEITGTSLANPSGRHLWQNGEWIYQPPTPDELLAQAKRQRQEDVDNIKVTVSSGKVFDGDETSQERMTRAIMAAGIINQTETTWVLADNTPTWVTLAELQEALALAMQAQAAVWTTPYTA